MNIKSVADSEVTITELMIPAYANFGGKVHGGILLSLMDKVAYVCASKYAGSYCVTVAVEGVEFLSPVDVGELVTLKATVNYVGRTSMIVGIRVESLHPQSGRLKHTNSCYFTMAAKDETGQLCEVPALKIEDETQLRRFCEGKMIRKLSLQKREYLKANLEGVSMKERLSMTENERGVVTFL
ncbi:MAG: acyl-CoA thioesterase [Flavobacteriales bacterium]